MSKFRIFDSFLKSLSELFPGFAGVAKPQETVSSNIPLVSLDPVVLEAKPESVESTPPAQSMPEPPKVPQPKTYRVTGIQHYMDNLMRLGVENSCYSWSKRDLIDDGLIDERIWETEFLFSKAEVIPEPDNPVDPKAIKVVVDGEHIGYIKAGSCAHLLKVIRENRILKIECEIAGGHYKRIDEDYDYDKDKEVYTLERGTAPYFATLYITEAQIQIK